MKWPSFRRKSSKLGSEAPDRDAVQEAEGKTEVPLRTPFTRSSTKETEQTVESVSTNFDSATIGSSASSNSLSVYDYLPKAGWEGAVDPRLRPSTLALAEKRAAKIEADFRAASLEESYPASFSRDAGTNFDSNGRSTFAGESVVADDVFGVLECDGCAMQGGCLAKPQESKLAQFLTGKLFPACM